MVKLAIYQKPTCTTCRRVYKMLQEARVDLESVNYFVDSLSKSKLKELLGKMKIPAHELLRKKEPIYKKLKLSEKKLSEDEIIDLMVKYPDLIQRPIVEKGAKAILARPPERLKEIL